MKMKTFYLSMTKKKFEFNRSKNAKNINDYDDGDDDEKYLFVYNHDHHNWL